MHRGFLRGLVHKYSITWHMNSAGAAIESFILENLSWTSTRCHQRRDHLPRLQGPSTSWTRRHRYDSPRTGAPLLMTVIVCLQASCMVSISHFDFTRSRLIGALLSMATSRPAQELQNSFLCSALPSELPLLVQKLGNQFRGMEERVDAPHLHSLPSVTGSWSTQEV